MIKITKEKCKENYSYWNKKVGKCVCSDPEYGNLLEMLNKTHPAHTFAYKYYNDSKDIYFYPLKSIFGYDERSNKFNINGTGLKAKAYRINENIPDHHMRTSKSLGHDIFLFAYLGIHNPYHRQKDAPPVRPFGIFLNKKKESFPPAHGSPCDVAKENPLVDRTNLDKYYVLPEDLRMLKVQEICNDKQFNKEFWKYYGNPYDWSKDSKYGDEIYQKTGEIRYEKEISIDQIEAILWPFFTDVVTKDGSHNIDPNLDLYSEFIRAFPNIKVIQYNHDLESNYEWDLSLVEASYIATKYFIKFGFYPNSIEFAKSELNER